MPTQSSCIDAFVACCDAVANGVLITRANRQDKEFHFQNWLDLRLTDAGLLHDPSGRNTYPDFTLVDYPEGYEVKGLAWPGRAADYDSNSRIPSGFHNGRAVFYVFGRYPADAAENEYPVIDLVVCHGDFLNADHTYVHENKSFRGFGSYGDIMVRDRKMYVAPTPFALIQGTTGQLTLVVPSAWIVPDERIEQVGERTRVDLRINALVPQLAPNPSAGREHTFTAYRRKGVGHGIVTMLPQTHVVEQLSGED
jgi:hypothetical protein